MSAKLMGHVWDLALPRSERDVLLAMADHADDSGNSVRPSIDHLAWKTDYSERQVQRAILSLKAKRIIEVVEGEDGGRGKIPEYRLFLHRAPKKTPWPIVRDQLRAARRKKGVTMSPIEKGDTSAEKGDTAAPIATEKGDIGDTKRVTSGAQKGDIRESSLFNEPPVKESPGEPPVGDGVVGVPSIAPSVAVAGASAGDSVPPSPRPPTTHQELFAAICDACGFDPAMLDELTAANIGRLAKECRERQFSAELILLAGEQWYTVKFKYRLPEEVTPPTVKQLRPWIGQCARRIATAERQHAQRATSRRAPIDYGV